MIFLTGFLLYLLACGLLSVQHVFAQTMGGLASIAAIFLMAGSCLILLIRVLP